jgi:hypothetical protein
MEEELIKQSLTNGQEGKLRQTFTRKKPNEQESESVRRYKTTICTVRQGDDHSSTWSKTRPQVVDSLQHPLSATWQPMAAAL